jgi:hypothetical protein
MKNTDRVPHNGDNKRRSSQRKKQSAEAAKYPAVKSRYGRDFDLAEGQKEGFCLATFNRETQRPALKVPLTDGEFRELFDTAYANGTNEANFMADLVREKLAALQPPKVIDVEHELDKARFQSHALHLMLIDTATSQGCDRYNDEIQCGILELVYATERRLKKAIALASSLMRDAKAATA